LGVQGMNEYGQHQGCKDEAEHKNISLRCRSHRADEDDSAPSFVRREPARAP
jgi:hypothetical protein